MSDGKDRQTREYLFQTADGLIDFLLYAPIQRRGSFIQEKEIGLLIKGSGYTYPLFLSSGKGTSGFAHFGIHPVGKILYPIIETNLFQQCLYPLPIDFFLTQSDVFGQGTSENKDFLRNITNPVHPSPTIN